MRILAYSLATFAIYAFQSTFVAIFAMSKVKPDFPLVVVLCVALMKGEKAGGFTGLVNGIIDDAIYGGFLGLSSMAKFFSGYISGYITRDVYRGPIIITMITVFSGSMLYNLLMAIFGSITGSISNPWYSFLSVALPSAMFNMAISPFVYSVIAKLERFFDYYFNIKY